MTQTAVQDKQQGHWQVRRQFEGDRDPEELMRALIQAHRR